MVALSQYGRPWGVLYVWLQRIATVKIMIGVHRGEQKGRGGLDVVFQFSRHVD